MAVGILLTVVRTLLYMAPDIPADAVVFVLLSHTVPYDRQPPRTDNYASCMMTHEESLFSRVLFLLPLKALYSGDSKRPGDENSWLLDHASKLDKYTKLLRTSQSKYDLPVGRN